MLTTISQAKLPLTVFEKGPILSALSAPDVFEKIKPNDLSAIYQTYEIVDRLIEVKITWRPIGGKSEDIDDLIKQNTQKAIFKSNDLLKEIQTILKQDHY